MQPELEAIRKYEDYIIGRAPFSLSGPADLESEADVLETGNEQLRREREKKIKDTKERCALAIIRYAIESILGWTPQEAVDSLTTDIMKQLYLDKVASYVQSPKDGVKPSDYGWLISMAFPNEVAFDVVEHTLSVYEKVKSGEISRYPKRFFDGDDGFYRLGVLLKDYISKNIPAGSVGELYQIFSDSAAMNVVLHEASLYSAYHEFFDTPLEYLHDALGAEGDDFLFDFYQFMAACAELDREKLAAGKKGEEELAVVADDN